MLKNLISASFKVHSATHALKSISKAPTQFQPLHHTTYAWLSHDRKHTHRHVKLPPGHPDEMPHRAGDWITPHPELIRSYVKTLLDRSVKDPGQWSDVVKNFRQVVETNPEIYMLFSSMFTEVPTREPWKTDYYKRPEVKNYMDFFCILNTILTTAPEWIENTFAGVPLFITLDWPMGTRSGYYAFINDKVNEQFKIVLDEWGQFLKSSCSTTVLNDKDGWMSEDARKKLMIAAEQENDKFEDVYVCDPKLGSTWGYKSWDEFFTREFREGQRPLPPDDPSVILSACESTPYHVPKADEPGPQLRDIFWIKRQPYSIQHILDNDSRMDQFVGGSIYQAFLSARNYHRWHSPVTGTVVDYRIVPGTYYAEASAFGFDPNWEPTVTDSEVHPRTLGKDGDQPVEPSRDALANAICDSQGYISQLATRALIFIQSDNPDIGLMCFVAIGMVEVSTCEFAPNLIRGKSIQKGDPLGMFHFGGSSHLLMFRKGVNLQWHVTDDPKTQKLAKVKSAIATVVRNK